MRTTIELPDELMTRAKVRAAEQGITLKELFVAAVEQSLNSPKKKGRFPPPIIRGGPVIDPTREQIAEAMSPIQHIIDEIERSRH